MVGFDDGSDKERSWTAKPVTEINSNLLHDADITAAHLCVLIFDIALSGNAEGRSILTSTNKSR